MSRQVTALAQGELWAAWQEMLSVWGGGGGTIPQLCQNHTT